MSKTTAEEALSTVEFYRDRYLAATPQDNFDRVLWQRLDILSASIDDSGKTSKVTYSITIPRTFGNHVGTMHCGAIATLFDGLTSSCLSLFAGPGVWNGSEITRSLDVKCFKPVPLEEPLKAKCEIVHFGRRLANITGIITKASDGSVLAACEHEKFNPNGCSASKL